MPLVTGCLDHEKNYTHLKLAPITDEHGSLSDSIHGCVAGSRL